MVFGALKPVRNYLFFIHSLFIVLILYCLKNEINTFYTITDKKNERNKEKMKKEKNM